MGDLVSIIIPTYGGGQYLERCVDSVLNQTYPDIEVIVVDDNGVGTPNQQATSKVMDKYAVDSRVHYICHQVNKNGSAARNTGVKASNGKYIGLVDDDDEYFPNKVADLIRELSNLPEEYALVFGNALGLLGDEINYENKAFVPEEPLFNILLHRFSIGTSAFLIRRTVWNSLGGFDEEFKRHQDWEFFARVIAKYKIKAVNINASVRHLTFRNTPSDTSIIVSYRNFYLQKMQPLIAVLPKKQQREVVVLNRLDPTFKYLIPDHNIKAFLMEYRNIKPGLLGIKSIIKRIVLHIKGVEG